MPITAGPSHDFTNGSASSLTMAHTSDANPLYVLLSWFVSAGGIESASIVTGVTFDGVALARGGHIAVRGNTLEWWKLRAPSAGMANVVITASAARLITATALNLSGWPDAIGNHTFAANGNISNVASPSVNAISSAGAEVIDFLGFNDPSTVLSPGVGQTELWNDEGLGTGTPPNADQVSAGSLKAGSSGVVAMSWSMTGDPDWWGHGALSFTSPTDCTHSVEDLEDPCAIKTPHYVVALQRRSDGSPDGDVYTAAKAPLRNPSTYLNGFVPARVLDLAPIRRAASDYRTGAWQAQTVAVTLADHDRFYRSLLSETDRDFIGSSMWVYLLSEAQRLAQSTPRLLFRGIVYDDPLAEYLKWRVNANDIISVGYGNFNDQTPIPRRRINRAPFPGLPDSLLEPHVGVPIPYGRLSDEDAATPAGKVKGINIGPLTLNGHAYPACLLWAGCAIKEFENFYQNDEVIDASEFGTTIWAPGWPNWDDIVPSGALYNDIGSERFTLTPLEGARAADVIAGKAICANLKGIEDIGDGTGTLIDDIHLQYKHLLLNWILGDSYFSGSWLPSPTYEYFPGGDDVCLVNTQSFVTASAQASVYLTGGFKGAFLLGAEGRRTTIRQVISDMNVCSNVFLGWNKYSQLFVTMLNRNRAEFLGNRRPTHWRRDSLTDPARVTTKKRDWRVNILTGQWGMNYRSGNWESTASVNDVASELRGRDERSEAYPMVQDDDTAAAVMQQRLDFMAAAPREYTWGESLCGLRNDVLDGIPVTDYNGDGPSGYINRAMLITGQTIDTKANRVTFTAFDVDDLMIDES